MNFWNEGEVLAAAQQPHQCPNVRRGVRLLKRLMEAVNEQSDGWAYWAAPQKSCEKLKTLIKEAGVHTFGNGAVGRVTAAELKAAVSPIRAMVTRQRRIQAEHGNRFEFDVDAALNE